MGGASGRLRGGFTGVSGGGWGVFKHILPSHAGSHPPYLGVGSCSSIGHREGGRHWHLHT